MAVLFDLFSYRVNEVHEGIFYDRWHAGGFPEISMPEKLYFLKSIISALLTHDKLFIRTDSIEEMIECIGFDAFRMLYDRGEIILLDNWWVPAFMLNGETAFFANMHREGYQDKIRSRLLERKGFEESIFVESVLKRVCSTSDANQYTYWDHTSQTNMHEDFSYNNKIRALLDIQAEDPFHIKNEADTWSAVRLCLFERSLEWAKQLETDEIILDKEARRFLVYKSDIESDSINHYFNRVLYAKGIPNLSLLYYNHVISMEDIIRVRDHIAFGKFTSWLESHNYDVRELEIALLDKRSHNNQVEKWFRWAVCNFVPMYFTSQTLSSVTSLGLSLLDQLLPQFSGHKLPNLFFDSVLSNQFDAKRMNCKLQSKF